MIVLRPFEESDFDRLIGWVSDARFLLQWAGPIFKHPLDNDQLSDYLAKSQGPTPNRVIWKAVDDETGQVIGHIEIAGIDRENKPGRLSRVLVGESHNRGKGTGKELVRAAVNAGFKEIGLEKISLAVFDFNESAIRCYEAIGFSRHDFKESAMPFEDECWNVVFMELNKADWAAGS